MQCFRRMLVIRHFEERLIALHDEGQARGHYHVYIGQEATAVPAISCLAPGDSLFTTHRNHGHLLARGAEPARLYAEIMGRRDGYNGGKGGTLHTAVPALGFHHTSAIVGGIIPLAAGAAYAAKARKTGALAVCLIGDGALEEGAAPETLNIASLWKLPVLFLCENNGKYGADRLSVAAQSRNMAAYPLTDLPGAYKIPAVQVDGSDAAQVYGAVSEAVEKIRRGEGPQFIETQTVRWPGNDDNWPVAPVATRVGLAWDANPVPEKQREWYRLCDPVLIFARELAERGTARREELTQLEDEVLREIDEAAKFALASPFPDPGEALRDVFVAEVQP
jgi:acetoin:2,6-dichlorophenolindophenol oxidoreductase subunit alpha